MDGPAFQAGKDSSWVRKRSQSAEEVDGISLWQSLEVGKQLGVALQFLLELLRVEPSRCPISAIDPPTKTGTADWPCPVALHSQDKMSALSLYRFLATYRNSLRSASIACDMLSLGAPASFCRRFVLLRAPRIEIR